MTNWIPVTLRLPETDGDIIHDSSDNVLVLSGGQQDVGYLVRHLWEGGPLQYTWYQKGRDSYTLENVTHWQPLPPLPLSYEEAK